MELLYTPKAATQLKDIGSYISGELQNPSVARSIQNKIMTDCESLIVFPEMGREVCLADDGRIVRLLVSGNYVVIYDVQGDNVIVVSVEDARTNWIALLLE